MDHNQMPQSYQQANYNAPDDANIPFNQQHEPAFNQHEPASFNQQHNETFSGHESHQVPLEYEDLNSDGEDKGKFTFPETYQINEKYTKAYMGDLRGACHGKSMEDLKHNFGEKVIPWLLFHGVLNSDAHGFHNSLIRCFTEQDEAGVIIGEKLRKTTDVFLKEKASAGDFGKVIELEKNHVPHDDTVYSVQYAINTEKKHYDCWNLICPCFLTDAVKYTVTFHLTVIKIREKDERKLKSNEEMDVLADKYSKRLDRTVKEESPALFGGLFDGKKDDKKESRRNRKKKDKGKSWRIRIGYSSSSESEDSSEEEERRRRKREKKEKEREREKRREREKNEGKHDVI
jgi:hypothetical protein